MTTQPQQTLNGLAYSEQDIFFFPAGLPGFERLTRFILTASPEHEPFLWLNSLENPQIRFVLVNPLLFCPDYDPAVTKENLADLSISRREDLALYVIVTLNPDARKSTANLAGPVLLNLAGRIGKQLILDDPRWSVRTSILRAGEA